MTPLGKFLKQARELEENSDPVKIIVKHLGSNRLTQFHYLTWEGAVKHYQAKNKIHGMFEDIDNGKNDS